MSTPDLPEIYDDLRRELSERLAPLDVNTLSKTVPATPSWTVKDLAAHLVAVAESIADEGLTALDVDPMAVWQSDVERQRLDEWTEAGVDRRRGHDIDSILSDWEESTVRLLATLRGEGSAQLPPVASYIVTIDLAVHAQDLLNCVAQPALRDHPAVGIGLAGYGFAVSGRFAQAGLGPLEIRYGDVSRVLGDGDPAASVTADHYELFRAFGGRRSVGQIAGYDWTGEAEPYIRLIPAYGPHDNDLAE